MSVTVPVETVCAGCGRPVEIHEWVSRFCPFSAMDGYTDDWEQFTGVYECPECHFTGKDLSEISEAEKSFMKSGLFEDVVYGYSGQERKYILWRLFSQADGRLSDMAEASLYLCWLFGVSDREKAERFRKQYLADKKRYFDSITELPGFETDDLLEYIDQLRQDSQFEAALKELDSTENQLSQASDEEGMEEYRNYREWFEKERNLILEKNPSVSWFI